MQRWSLAPWLLEQSRFLYQRMSSFSYSPPQRLEDFPIFLYHFVCPSFHIVLPLNLLVYAISKLMCNHLVAQVSTGLLKLAAVPCSCGTTEFGPQAWLQSVSSLDASVVPQLWSFGQWWSARAWKNSQLPVVFMNKFIFAWLQL